MVSQYKKFCAFLVVALVPIAAADVLLGWNAGWLIAAPSGFCAAVLLSPRMG